VKPEPQAPEPAPLAAVARLCNLTAPSMELHRRTVRTRRTTAAFVPRYINGTFSRGVFANGTGPTLKARSSESGTPVTIRAENTTYASHARVPIQRRAALTTTPYYPFTNGTSSSNTTSSQIHARGLNTTVTATSRAHGRVVLPRGAVPPQAQAPYQNTTLPRIQNRATNTSAAGTVPFANGTFSANGVAGRKPPVVRRAARVHLPLPVRFYA